MTTHLVVPDPHHRKEIERRSRERCSIKPCSRCGNSPRKKNTSWCQACVTIYNREEWQARPEHKKRAKWLKTKYRLTYDEYYALFVKQDGLCAICKNKISVLKRDNSSDIACVDHCHTTGRVRGLLCNHCNRAIGLFKEDRTTIQNALEYLS